MYFLKKDMWGADASSPTNRVLGSTHEYVWALSRQAGFQAGMANCRGAGFGDLCTRGCGGGWCSRRKKEIGGGSPIHFPPLVDLPRLSQ